MFFRLLKMVKSIIWLATFFNFVHGLAAMGDIACSKNHTLLEIPGEAMLSLFADINYGPYCNETSLKGFQEVSTAVHVIRTVNKQEYLPGISIGVRVFDTCHNRMTLYKQTLTAVVNLDCTTNYELGVLAPASYSKVLQPFQNYSLLPISFYTSPNFSVPLMEATASFVSSRFAVIDLLLTSSTLLAGRFLDIAKEHGICVKNHETITTFDNSSEIVIVTIGRLENIRQWRDDFEDVDNRKVVWVMLPLDDVFFEDTVPIGSYVVKSEPVTPGTIDGLGSIDEFVETTKKAIVHSPFLLGIGKTVTEIALALKNLKTRSCSQDGNCILPRFNAHLLPVMTTDEIYETLRIPKESQFVKYIVIKRTDEDDYLKVASYKVSPSLKSIPEGPLEKLPNLCLKKLVANCNRCVNFQQKVDAQDLVEGEVKRYFLRSNEWVPIYLTIVSCGTFASIVVVVFIVYRYLTEQVLDGNPSLTIVLALANVFLMQSVFPFCMDDEFMGQEHLNSRKIFVTTLSFGFVFSIILSRALFLAFSNGGMFSAHINGYLQTLMIFFMAGVQVALSTMYFFLSESDSAVVVRSLMFIALLSYDIFLLIILFVICCFIAQIQRNYREGKCFFATVIGLLVVWAIWLTSFILVEPEVRDIIVCFGIVSTALLIIIGILIPRTYYMVTYLRRDKTISRRFEAAELGPDPRMNNAARQFQPPFYEYIRPAEGATSFTTLPVVGYPNYYGSSSPATRHFDRNRQPELGRSPGYNNYGFHSEMREMENAYVIPHVCVENPEGFKSTVGQNQRLPRKPKLVLQEKECVETDIYVEDRLSPVPRGPNESYPKRCSSPKLSHVDATIQEEDEYEERASRVTRF